MNFGQSFRLALKSLMTSKMRALLTMLGIIIGVGAVIVITSLGNGMQNMMNEQFEKLGANLVQVQLFMYGGDSRSVDPDDMYELVDKYPQYISGVTPYVSAQLAVRQGSEDFERTSIYGVGETFLNERGATMSGQQQRVSIARALAGSPSVILADEPTGALDSRTGREVLGFLKKLNREGDTVVLITHDNSIAVKADRIVRLQDGKIIYDGDAHDPRAVVRPEEMEQDEPAAGGFSDASPAEQEAGA